ncbi:MAG: hypothetical protein ACRELX_08795 [Longimicrobiales bacterium]
MWVTLLLLLATGSAVVLLVTTYTTFRRRRARQFYQRRLEVALTDGILTEEEIAELDALRAEKDLTSAEVRMAARATYRTVLREAMKDAQLSDEVDRSLTELQAQLGLSERDLGSDFEQLCRLRTLARVERGDLPEIESPITLVPHEQCHWVVQAAIAERLDLPRPGRRELRGILLRVLDEARFSARGSRDALRPNPDILPNDLGILVVTSRRTVFQGVKRTVSTPHARLESLTLFEDGFRPDELAGESRGYFLVDDAELTTAVILIAARKRRREIKPVKHRTA